MKAYYQRNTEKRGIEIYFEERPDNYTRDLLKKNQWHWNSNKMCWYNKYTQENEEFAKELVVATESEDTNILKFINFDGSEISIVDDIFYSNSTNDENRQDNDTSEGDIILNASSDNYDNEHEELTIDSIFLDRSNCLRERSLLRNLLMDFFSSDRLRVNVILAGYDYGITKRIDEIDVIDSVFFNKSYLGIKKDFGLTDESAKEATLFWINSYGKGFCGKAIEIDLQDIEDEKENPKATSEFESRNDADRKPLDLSLLTMDEKLPKDIIIRDMSKETQLGIINLSLSAYLDIVSDETYTIKILDQIAKKGTKDSYLCMHIVLHNEKGEPIGMELGLELHGSRRKYSSEHSITIPKNELLADITVNFTPYSTQFDD